MRKRLKRSAHRSTRALEETIRDYHADNNANPKPFVWTKTADEILAKAGLYFNRLLKNENVALQRASLGMTKQHLTDDRRSQVKCGGR